MKTINTIHLSQCIKTLELSLERLIASDPKSIEYEVFRNATVKGFELTLETTGKLLRKMLNLYVGFPRLVDELTYKDLFRQAVKFGLINTKTAERWFIYRDNRNDTAHDYGIAFASTTLKLLPDFLKDVKEMQQLIEKKLSAS